jgi:hypothetical protein
MTQLSTDLRVLAADLEGMDHFYGASRDIRTAVELIEAYTGQLNLQGTKLAGLRVIENRAITLLNLVTPIPDSDSVYVPKVAVQALRDATEGRGR